MRDRESKERIDKWLEAALNKIETMPRDELLAALEKAGLVAPKEENE